MRPLEDRYCERLTYAAVRDAAVWACATAAAAVGIFGALGAAAGIPGALAAALFYGAAAGVSRWLGSLERYDSPLADWAARPRTLAFAGLFAWGLTAMATVLAVRGPIVAWLVLWIPAAAVLAVLVAAPRRDGSLAAITWLSFAVAGLGTLSTTWASAPVLALFLGAWCAMRIADGLARRTRATLLQGRANLRDLATLLAGSAASPCLALLIAGLAIQAMPGAHAAWARGAVRSFGPIPGFALDPNDAGEGGAGGDGGDGSATDGPDSDGDVPPSELPAAAARRMGAFFREIQGVFAANARRIVLGLVGALAALTSWGAWRLWRARRLLRAQAEPPAPAPDASPGRKRRAPPPAPPDDPRGAVIHYYNRFRREIGPHGYKPLPALAPGEYARFLALRVPTERESIGEITGLFEGARYGPDDPPPEARERAAACYRRILARVAGSPAPTV